ncbi:hypothetical protein SM0020_32120 [Sinorhizobium meliloti CCNWSX0020]|uniref:Uncharacterized protein n=1 Tax=Sinorhizobium meliloti CCNWSX0020 TaxID=1107881 RepID=H0GA65_RHIML|nr:hypothetical protein SM0020_32120 [Sinorhizobium meliloti CCNWSX0020]PII38222.1 hypothetical protein T190_24295 [Sinorhizobium meliloti CCBAU 01290]
MGSFSRFPGRAGVFLGFEKAPLTRAFDRGGP